MSNEENKISKYKFGEKFLKVPAIIHSFGPSKNKVNCYKCENSMESFSKNLREQVMERTNYDKKEIIPITNKENKSYERQKVCYICKKEFGSERKKEKRKIKFSLHWRI